MLAEKGFKVLNLSKKEILHNNIINRFIGYSEMPEYLNAADCAIIWRDKSVVKKVAEWSCIIVIDDYVSTNKIRFISIQNFLF